MSDQETYTIDLGKTDMKAISSVLVRATLACQEATLLLEAIDRDGLDVVDLSGWSRLRVAIEVWRIEASFDSSDVQQWQDEIGDREIAPGIMAAKLRHEEDDP